MILGNSYLRNATSFPERVALSDGIRTLSHADFLTHTIRTINALVSEGAQRQDRVAVLAQNSIEMVEVLAAAELGGFIVLPFNHRLAVPEIVDIAKDARPRFVFYQQAFAEHATAVSAACGAKMIALDGEAVEGRTEYEVLKQSADAGSLRQQATEDDGVHMVYTSGTTGRPKGVLLGQRGQVEMVRTMSASMAVQSSDKVLVVMPLFHVGGMAIKLAQHWQGAGVHLLSKFDPDALVQAMKVENVTTVHLAPVMIRMLLETSASIKDFPNLHTIVYGSSPIPRRDLTRAIQQFGSILIQYYGMTETGPLSTVLDKSLHVITGDETTDARLASAGLPQIGVQIEVRRPVGQPAAIGEAGEVHINTPTLMLGYWDSTQGCAGPQPRGWFGTGDVGYFGKDGCLYLVDRKKDMIVSGGENIYSREVEEALLVHPGVSEVAVIGVPHPKWGECVAAYVVRSQGDHSSAEALIEHCKRQIASYKKPHHVFFTDALPRLKATGKIDKKTLRIAHWPDGQRFVA